MLVDDLSFESDGPGRLRLVLTGADRRLLTPTLDAVAMTMASESARQAPRRDDGARASLNGEQTGGGYASLIGGAVSAEVLIFTGLIAGAALVTSLLLVGLVYLVLARAKRVFEEAESESGTEFAT
jgi:predicted lipid-binding transport protein (Tim44 family)